MIAPWSPGWPGCRRSSRPARLVAPLAVSLRGPAVGFADLPGISGASHPDQSAVECPGCAAAGRGDCLRQPGALRWTPIWRRSHGVRAALQQAARPVAGRRRQSIDQRSGRSMIGGGGANRRGPDRKPLSSAPWWRGSIFNRSGPGGCAGGPRPRAWTSCCCRGSMMRPRRRSPLVIAASETVDVRRRFPSHSPFAAGRAHRRAAGNQRPGRHAADPCGGADAGVPDSRSWSPASPSMTCSPTCVGGPW